MKAFLSTSIVLLAAAAGASARQFESYDESAIGKSNFVEDLALYDLDQFEQDVDIYAAKGGGGGDKKKGGGGDKKKSGNKKSNGGNKKNKSSNKKSNKSSNKKSNKSNKSSRSSRSSSSSGSSSYDRRSGGLLANDYCLCENYGDSYFCQDLWDDTCSDPTKDEEDFCDDIGSIESCSSEDTEMVGRDDRYYETYDDEDEDEDLALYDLDQFEQDVDIYAAKGDGGGKGGGDKKKGGGGDKKKSGNKKSNGGNKKNKSSNKKSNKSSNKKSNKSNKSSRSSRSSSSRSSSSSGSSSDSRDSQGFVNGICKCDNDGYNSYCKDLWDDLCSKNDISPDEDSFCDFVGSEKCHGTSSNLRGSDAMTE